MVYLLIATTGIWYLGEQWGLQVNYSPIETADTEASSGMIQR